ncbi:hypothetical protein [Mumia sp.]|uniref:hypothetical protein n=1 Tax=Mumia sp. TaxID=1965300 RepID=UPI0026280160|nr:hypothetical protein [Mumia sp.]MDD9348657.1 hypothetical protein [Mumia sp.]
MFDSLRKYRDIFSYALLGIVAATLLAHFIALLDDRGWGSWANAALNPGLVLVTALAVAIAAPRKDDLSSGARTITIAAIAVLGVSIALGLWGLIKALSEDLYPNKASFTILVLATLALNGLVIFAAVTLLRELPAPARAPKHQQAWGGQQQGPWGQPQGGQQGWPAQQQPQPQQWADQGGWPQQGLPQQQSPQAPQPQQQSWQGYGAGAAGAAAAGYGAAEAAQHSPSWGTPSYQAPEAPAPEEPAEQSTAVWTPPAEEPSTDLRSQSPGQEQPASAWGAQPPEQQPNADWGSSAPDAGWGRDSQWSPPEQPIPSTWAQPATEQPTWQPPSEYGSTWPQPPQPPQPEQQSYTPPEQPAQPTWQGEGGGWGSSSPSTGWSAPTTEPEGDQPVARLGNATFDAVPEKDATYEAGTSTGESSDKPTDGEDGGDEPRSSSWWTPGSGS